MFSLSVGAAAVCTLASLGLLQGTGTEAVAVEASVFNGTKNFQSQSTASDSSKSAPTSVVPLGSVFGIKLFTDGVIVASLSDIYTENGMCSPAADAGIKPGDYLLEANGQTIINNAALANTIGQSEGKTITLKIRRDDKIFEADVTPVFSEGAFKTGLWIRDSAAGIGTLTFYDPATGKFGGLGHGICDMDTSGVMALKSGEPAPITLCGIEKGTAEQPGQLKGYFSSDNAMGTLLANNETGVYGTLADVPIGTAVDVLPREQVHCGAVKLLVTVDDNGPCLYDAEIESVSNPEQRTRNLVIRVTDPELLALTGGIVQGMSGTPILQDGKLAGAITHVFKDEPMCGYGIFAQTMCEELANTADG